MNRRIRTLHRSSSKRDEAFHRYLKPGALAQLRDSRISARSHRVDSHSQIHLHRTSSPPSSPLPPQIDAFPCFAGRNYGPRCLQRKKLVAAKSVFLKSSSPASPMSESPDSVVVDLFGPEILVAHWVKWFWHFFSLFTIVDLLLSVVEQQFSVSVGELGGKYERWRWD